MGTHGHGTLKRVVLGSFAEKVRHATDVPLLLVKARAAADEAGGVRMAGDADAPGDPRSDEPAAGR